MSTTFFPKALGNTNLSHRRPAALNQFLFGSTYYPEHWDTQTRELDAERMAKAGFNVVRMAEFAGDLMEPREGSYDFSLFDETIERLGAKGIQTILCTPTATPPRWLSKKHPEMLRVDANGIAMQHGSRQHACHASPILRQYSRNITTAMAQHYKENPFVIGWQTDNEFLCHFSECHCESCQRDFALFLREKYEGDITRLNQAWGTAFWAQTYDQFEDIPTPRDNKPAYPNPSHVLDYNRYLSASVTLFQHEQVEILRREQPRWWVTHNGLFRHIDYRGLFTKDLDFLGFDAYPFFHHDPETRPYRHAFNVDRARGWSGHYIVLEQQSGPGGQRPYIHDTPEPGEMRRMMYTSIAHGADSFLHFRWRTCRFGAEEYWCGILDHDNVPRRRYEEAVQEGRELKKIGPHVLGTHVHIDVAVACCDMEVNDAHATYTLGLPEHNDIAQQVHQSLAKSGYAVGLVHPSDDLSGLKMYIVPHWAYWDPAWTHNLRTFVENGGHLIVGARTATRDPNNTVVADTLPGDLRNLVGATVEEYGKQNEPDSRPLHLRFGDTSLHSKHWYEALKPDDGTEVLSTWEGRHLTGQPAISYHPLGKGAVVYVGTYLNTSSWELVAPELAKRSGLTPLWADAPETVEVVLRRDEERKLWFFMNRSDDAVTIPSTPNGTDLITDKKSGGSVTLERYGVSIILES